MVSQVFEILWSLGDCLIDEKEVEGGIRCLDTPKTANRDFSASEFLVNKEAIHLSENHDNRP